MSELFPINFMAMRCGIIAQIFDTERKYSIRHFIAHSIPPLQFPPATTLSYNPPCQPPPAKTHPSPFLVPNLFSLFQIEAIFNMADLSQPMMEWRGAGARENRGREGYGRRGKKGREAGEKFQKASFR